jgi:hypothetical protein
VALHDDDTFLGRWSRRKHAARRGEALPEPAPEQPAEPPAATLPPAPAATATPADAAPAELPAVDSLKGLESEYQAFLRPGVDPATRSAALNKLFNDPHFHFDQMDKLDTYIDDYTKADPIAPAMLRLLSQARGLGLFDGEEQAERPAGDAQAAAGEVPAAAALEPPAAPAEPTEALPADVPGKTGEA